MKRTWLSAQEDIHIFLLGNFMLYQVSVTELP